MADEKLEKKTGIKLPLYGILGALALGASIGIDLWVYHFGGEEGYQEGKKAGIIEGQKAGLAESKEQMPRVKLEFQPSAFGETAQDVSFFVKQTNNGITNSYQLSTYLNATFADDRALTPIVYLDESVFVTGEAVNMEYKDSDVGFRMGAGPSKKICSGKHDGLVDYIINHAVSSNEPDRRLLCRDQNYEVNRAAFDEADRIFNEIRSQFFVSE